MNNSDKPALEPAILVIFGITGDLSKRYLLPALYHLVKNDLLHEQTEIIGITRGKMTIDDLLEKIELCINEVDGLCEPAAVAKLKSKLHMRSMDLDNADEYDNLGSLFSELEDKHGVCMNRLYYLSVPPKVAQPIITLLGERRLNKSCQHGNAGSRLLAEKPFGYDLESAKDMIKETAKHFSEDQVFRIDHYLAKDTVQNMLAFRFNNPIFEPLWDHEHIDYIEVLADESLDIEGRVNFYEQTGALKDSVQSHLMQILALVIMEQPSELTSIAIHRNKLAALEQIETINDDQVADKSVRGQYEGYKQEVDNPDSRTETYAALKLNSTSNRWKKVPLVIHNGKALKEKLSEVNVVFKPTDNSPHHNVMTFRIQPNEGIELSLRVKRPGLDDEIRPVEMDFSYQRSFPEKNKPNAYERVLVDAVRGDHTLFATSEEIIESWRVVDNVARGWAKDDKDLIVYKKGSLGPDITKLYSK